MNLTKEEAQIIQDTILSKVQDTIPHNVVKPLWQQYVKIKGLRENSQMPCTGCSAAPWIGVLSGVKEAVENALREEIIPEVIELPTEEEIVAVKAPANRKKAISKKK